jgi:hypothetical protein
VARRAGKRNVLLPLPTATELYQGSPHRPIPAGQACSSRIAPATCGNDVPLETVADRSVPMGCGRSVDQAAGVRAHRDRDTSACSPNSPSADQQSHLGLFGQARQDSLRCIEYASSKTQVRRGVRVIATRASSPRYGTWPCNMYSPLPRLSHAHDMLRTCVRSTSPQRLASGPLVLGIRGTST